MSDYEATIVRTIITRIKISAASTQEANDALHNYGLIEAANDYPQTEPETLISKISSIKRRKYTAQK